MLLKYRKPYYDKHFSLNWDFTVFTLYDVENPGMRLRADIYRATALEHYHFAPWLFLANSEDETETSWHHDEETLLVDLGSA